MMQARLLLRWQQKSPKLGEFDTFFLCVCVLKLNLLEIYTQKKTHYFSCVIHL